MRLCDRLLESAFSESEEELEFEFEDVVDFGGDGFSDSVDICLIALRVRRTGAVLSTLFGSWLVRLGIVKAQLSHGEALFRSFSSYVRRKLESRLLLFDAPDNMATRGLSGGVVATSEAAEFVLATPLITTSPVVDLELALGRRELDSSSS